MTQSCSDSKSMSHSFTKTLEFSGLRFRVPAAAEVTLEDGKLRLGFASFTGSIVVEPDQVSPTQSPPGGAAHGKRARTDADDDNQHNEHTDMLSQRHRPVSASEPHVFKNGGTDYDALSSDEDAPPSSRRKHHRRTGDPSQRDLSQPSAEAKGLPSGGSGGDPRPPSSPKPRAGGRAGPSNAPAGSQAAGSDEPAASPDDEGGEEKGRAEARSPAAPRSPHPFEASQPLARWEWQKLAATGDAPSPRWAHAAVALGEAIFVFGGDGTASDDGSGALNDLYRLDTESKEWRRCMDAPQRRAWHSGVMANNILLVFGGETLNDKGRKAHLGTMWSYDPEFEVWYEATDRGHRPCARAGHAACVHEANGRGVKMLVFGGVARGDRYLEPELHELHVGADWSWRKVLSSGPRPDARAYHTCTPLDGGRVLVFGGNDASQSFEQVHLLELASMTWSCPAVSGTPPTPRTGHAAVCLDGRRLLIHGGWDPRQGGDEPEIWDDLIVLDTQRWEWLRPPVHGAPPSPRTGHTLVGCGGALYLFGGLGEEDVLGDAYVLVPQ